MIFAAQNTINGTYLPDGDPLFNVLVVMLTWTVLSGIFVLGILWSRRRKERGR